MTEPTVTVTRDLFGFELVVEHATHTQRVKAYRSNVVYGCGLLIDDGTRSTGVTLDPGEATELARWIIDTFGADGP